MIIMFCGPDRVGKTEIAKTLASKSSHTYFKSKKEAEYFSKENFLDALHYDQSYFIQLCEQAHEQGHELELIMDRGYPCEYAYAKHFNRRTDEKFIWELDKRFSKLNTLIIVCYKVNNKVKDRLVSIHDYDGLLKQYECFASKSFCDVFFLNTTSYDLTKEFDDLRSFIHLHKVRRNIEKCNFCERLMKNNKEVWGKNHHPLKSSGHGIDYAFVGIAPGRGSMKLKDKSEALHDAFRLGSGEVLRSMIDDLNILKQSYITNVIKCATPSDEKFKSKEYKSCFNFHLRDELRSIKKTIFVMGNQAADGLAQSDFDELAKDTGVQVVPIYHPAFIMRSSGTTWMKSAMYKKYLHEIGAHL